MSIVVPATSGHLGRLIVTELLDRGVPAGDIVAGARNLDAITDLAEAGVRTTVLDYDDPSTVEAALSSGDTFVLISSKDLANRQRQHADAIAAAKRAGAGHIVYTSGLRAAQSPSPIAASHAPTEDDVRDSGLPFTIVRNGWYTENYAATIPRCGTAGSCSPASARAGSPRPRAATSPRPSARSSPATGTSGRPTSCPATSPGTTPTSPQPSARCWGGKSPTRRCRLRTTSRCSRAPECPEQFAEMGVAVDAGIAAGAFAYQNGDLARLIGRPTTPLVEGLRPLV